MLWMDFRTIKTSSEARRRAFLGALTTEVEKIRKVLDLLTHLPWDMNDKKKGKAEEASDREAPQSTLQSTPDAPGARFLRAPSSSSKLAEVPSEIEKEEEYESLTEKFALDLTNAFADIDSLSAPTSSAPHQVSAVQRPRGVTDLDWDMLSVVMENSMEAPKNQFASSGR